jgi:protein phosphatase
MKTNPHILACSKTDQGRRRLRNEDVCLADVDRCVFMVADGMGGRAGGDVASALFLEAVNEIFTEPGDFLSVECQALIESTFSLANNKILAHVAVNPHHSGMGCTAELVVFCRDHYLVGHVGDSRTYLFRGEKLCQLTHDHSLVQEQLELGFITRDQAEKSQLRNVLLRAVGVDATVTVDIIGGRIEPGDIFLLCSDGLHGMVRFDEILSVLAYQAPLSLKADMLIDMANNAGGHDNISVTLVESVA